MKARKGCWTCAARKIQCDESRPTCKKCARSQIKCQGYESRLSWPKNNDTKRAIVGHDAPQVIALLDDPSQIPSSLFFINTGWHDVELYRYLSLRIDSVPSSPDLWKLRELHAGHTDSFQYFYEIAHLSLVTFGVTTSQIRNELVTMAMARDTSPGLALFYALLAYSSLHRNGLISSGSIIPSFA
ncbi:hypothetical protein FZEAL_724 [Fusarium zealandicum]|uniref:Zn(2)-C6 fungal-type domain-containing protein n=1 Tax=Fusarium zealandicum TaxID=1053134 RepID=A0A8H4UUZ6_9HYPO|nr:hypothetical protein FZEAL_724 [Fusarium zealandicum]